jgi:large subunit ribosomal protein L1
MAKKSKKYRAALEKVDRTKKYAIADACELIKEIAFENFDASVELAMNLNLNPRKAEQNIRGAMVLPHGTGKSKTVLVFAQGDKAKEAEEAGADYVGAKDLVEKIEGGWMDFDVAIATPDMMGTIGKIGRYLGPKGLMPNPKDGTVTMDVGQAVSDSKGGKIQYRVDKHGNIQAIVGKTSFATEKLEENIRALVDTIAKLRPATVKGVYLRNVAVSTTMGPGVKIDVSAFKLN